MRCGPPLPPGEASGPPKRRIAGAALATVSGGETDGGAVTEIAERYGRVADGFARRLRAVRAPQWAETTPCPDWSVRDLVVHVVATHRRVLASLHGGEPGEVEPTGDLLAQWDAATGSVRAALADPEVAGRTIGGMFGEQPFESLVSRLLCADTLVHTWDLARATGQEERLDPEAVGVALEFLGPLDEAIRRPGGFGPRIEPAPGADEQVRFLNFCGRAV